jgi:AraC-like DNA-binding protein
MTFYLVHGMAWFYLVLSVILFFIPEILYGLPSKQMGAKQVVPENFNQGYKEEVKIEISNKEEEYPGYSQVFTDDYIEEMGEIILKYLESKPYLDPGFNQTMMSVAIGLPMHHLSYYFNHVIKQKFTNWRNNFRVQYAKELIESGKAELFSLDSIGKDCGFSNQTTFIKAFKQEMKITPGDYIRFIK